MAKNIEDILGAEDPATATPDGTDGEENPLAKMDKITKEKPEDKKSGSKELDADTITEMLKTGENTDGMFTPDGEEEHEDEDKGAKVKVGSKVEPSEKYEKNFKDDMLKHPNEYKVNTPRGEMTIAEAMRAGYNPITKTFEKNHSQEDIKQKLLAGLNDADKAALEQFTSPSNARVAPADAEMYGLPQGSPMIRPMEQPNPTPGIPAGAPNPVGTALPGSEESMAPGGIDLSALTGGAQQ